MFDQDVRWVAVKNVTELFTETPLYIPGYAIMFIHPGLGTYNPIEWRDGQAVYKVSQPDYACEQLQDSSLLLCNGPTPIPPGGYGRAVQGWPSQVLHDGANDDLNNAQFCGPRDGSWAAWSNRTALVCIGHIEGKGGFNTNARGTMDGIHTIMVGPRTGLPPIDAFKAFAAESVVAGDDIISIIGFDVHGAVPHLFEWDGTLTDLGSRIIVQEKAKLWLSASATVSSTEASEGDLLGMEILKNGSPTQLYGYRKQMIDTYGSTSSPSEQFYSAENISFSGLLEVDAGDEISLHNYGSVATTFAGLIFSGHATRDRYL
jgi:hypothetical protein